MNNMHLNDKIDALITEYLTGNPDKNTLASLKKWASASTANRDYVRMKCEEWLSAGVAAGGSAYDYGKAYARFMRRVETARRIKTQHRMKRVLATAAAVVMIATLPLAGYLYGTRSAGGTEDIVCIETQSGSPVLTTLPDGTKVWLNSKSRLEYPRDYGVKERRMKIEGEGCFDVTHNDDMPLEVTAGEASVKVLGTKFTVSDYADDDEITVDLIRGKVYVADNRRGYGMTLSPNQRMTLTRKSGRMRKTAINAATSDKWTQGELIFDEMPLTEIAKELERKYGVEIDVENEVRGKRFYAIFNTNKHSAADILEAISKTNRMKYKFENGKYTLFY